MERIEGGGTPHKKTAVEAATSATAGNKPFNFIIEQAKEKIKSFNCKKLGAKKKIIAEPTAEALCGFVEQLIEALSEKIGVLNE